ncbi:allophanate hydrolase [Paenibacillus thailandensis]|uniref:Allophanate hydrolase n=1 Tax=Paenibacillus thailandensis TaxID=393250 RepID=A0ABW5QVV9_9BACL
MNAPIRSIALLRQAYTDGTITPERVMSDIVRLAEEEADMNIWITPPSMERIGPYLEALRRIDPAGAPLWGIPFAVKDNIDVAGMPTTAGCPDYAYTPAEHAEAVRRLVEAGAVPVGKTNLDQFATGLVGTRSPYGETHNALRPELISGGSSSGSAVAVARGQAAFALGTDTAGSGRVPAALNGLVGYKPSLGAWPVRGVVPACESLDCVTVFANAAGDALLIDRIVRGVDRRDLWSRALPEPTSSRPSGICLPRGELAFYGPLAERYAAAWKAAVCRLEACGLPVEYVDIEPFEEAAAILYEGPWIAERWAGLGAFIEANPGAALPVTESILRSGAAPELGAASVFKAMHRLRALKLKAHALLRDAVLVLPTCGGTWTRVQVAADPLGTNRDMGRYTNHCNLLDLCAVALPAGEAEAGAPFGITAFAAGDREDLIRGFALDWTGEAATGGPAGAEAAPEALEAPGNGASPSAVPAAAASAPAGEEATPGIAAETDTRSATRVVNGADTVLVAVCGLHMRGFPLERQMKACGAEFVRESNTAAAYKLVKLPTSPPKPGLIRQADGGSSVALEVWEMPAASFGAFVASIPAPLGIGKVELADGSEVPGFVCEGYAEAGAEDITVYGGWRNAAAAGV